MGGWGRPLRARKWHYFVGFESLCGRWWYKGEKFPDGEASPEGCKECRRKYGEREGKEE